MRSVLWRIISPIVIIIAAGTVIVAVMLANGNLSTLDLVAIAVVMTLAAVFAVWRVSSGVSRSLREVTAAARRMTAGQLGQTALVRGSKEEEDLARAFNEMSASTSSAVQEVSAERTRLATVLSNMTDGVVMTDAEGKVVIANDAAARLFGFQSDSVGGRYFIEIVRDYELEEVMKRSLRTGTQQSAQVEAGVTRRFIRAIAVPISGQKLNGCVLLFQDLTELRGLQTMRRELIGNISHDLRTPISGIKAMVETLREGAIEDRVAGRDFLHRIEGEVDRLAQMVAELTELSRIESGKVELKLEPVDMNGLIEDVLSQLKPLAERNNVTLAMLRASDLPKVTVDRERIRSVLVNLVHNAIKFNRPDGKVTVAAASDGTALKVSVMDTGAGISKEDLPHVFERFFKSDRSRGGGGSGLGLAIAKHAVQAHGGAIWAESQEGKGSTFVFTLPLQAKPPSDRKS